MIYIALKTGFLPYTIYIYCTSLGHFNLIYSDGAFLQKFFYFESLLKMEKSEVLNKSPFGYE